MTGRTEKALLPGHGKSHKQLREAKKAERAAAGGKPGRKPKAKRGYQANQQLEDPVAPASLPTRQALTRVRPRFSIPDVPLPVLRADYEQHFRTRSELILIEDPEYTLEHI
ncbi:hypothetical protein CLAFUW4_01223 [Fulvia fulva]|uniref:Uncharacterized protein n=1 Tax=Passalora fulva TaxID=5499 RepID=A0A9Q8L7X2_PASFU|nr:uncharacterized protein CLAFUR5_01228 [Fulvia fulva]KAK4634315.1 hypothetical protein CLAFUR4_01224 [Fulvia fulva]KAK4638671.1 hypothetical protein CLAFUR0_01225 [Fulvia fulva]UJO12446.1 hypothetical protein CLAFUR5_01228 [Fulvia fulva]WPV08678.1 hypothetical protein CLAFUW4_01223 [Fulvia fulva]WPV23634.1 hypothetical protein CLAFUW7_01228 [Fulvia fulva]